MQSNDDLTLIVDRTALIENMLNQAIEGFCSPRKEAFSFFWNVLLDSSVLTLGAKVKIAMAISQEMHAKLEQDALHSVVSLRNAFAHHATNSHPVLTVGITPEGDQLHYTLQIIGNSGKVTRKRREEALADFNSCYETSKTSLKNLIACIRRLQSSSPSM
jgi:hypothetical protein